MGEPPVCPMPAWMERALARDGVALAVRALAWGACAIIWGYLAFDLLLDALLRMWACGVPA